MDWRFSIPVDLYLTIEDCETEAEARQDLAEQVADRSDRNGTFEIADLAYAACIHFSDEVLALATVEDVYEYDAASE